MFAMCASIVAKLQGSGISNSLVSSIVGYLDELTSEIYSQAKHTAISALQHIWDKSIFWQIWKYFHKSEYRMETK